MFKTALAELRAWWWMIRCKTASTLALAGLVFITASLNRAQAGRRVFATTTIGALLIRASRWAAPAVITKAADAATEKQFGK